jgi:hypothetical protein
VSPNPKKLLRHDPSTADLVRANRRPLHDGEPRGIFDGAERVGHVVKRDKEFVAFSKRHEAIGRYDDAFSAAEAVLRRVRSERRQ